MEDSHCEKFYVYRSLHTDDSWGAITIDGNSLARLPNIDFGMKVFAVNEKEAISKAKVTYDRVHKFDNDKENIRTFAAAALKHCVAKYADFSDTAEMAMKYAIVTNIKFNEHFAKLEKDNENE